MRPDLRRRKARTVGKHVRLTSSSLGVGLFAIALCSGCYSLQPIVGPSPLLGSTISIGLNDAGRAILGGTMGPAIDEIEGRLVQQDSVGYTVAVASVRFLRGGEQTWTGERVQVTRAFISEIKEKKFSRSRTAIISAVALASVAVFVTRAIIGSGQGDQSKAPMDSTAQTTRIPWR